MYARRIAVLGGGMAGLSTSLALARDGHAVVLLERDHVSRCAPEDAFGWERKGIAHFLQPHAFIPRGRHELKTNFPDVYAALLQAGAVDVDVSRKLPGSRESADDLLRFMGVRRPLIEWGLRQAVLAEPGIEVRSGVTVSGIRLEGSRVAGVDADGQALPADVVVDAMGRRSPMRGWLAELGFPTPPARRSDCGVIYYSRYYRLRPGAELPDGPWLLGPRGDLGYLGFNTFPGDNRTFSALLAVPTGVTEFKGLMHERAFDAAVASIPLLAKWVDPSLAEPVTGVMPMGGLQNSLHDDTAVLPSGLFPVADALCHTDPVLAHGLSFSLIHARELSRALAERADPIDAFAGYRAAVLPALVERFEFASALDAQRLRMWTGGGAAFAKADGDYALFSLFAAGAVALADPDVFRVFVRRIGLLDSTRVLDEDVALQQRIEGAFAELSAKPRPAPGPARDEMLALIQAANGA